ncbi:hypothetical protein ACVWYO_000120 [Sphingomonas sp. UYP23]
MCVVRRIGGRNSHPDLHRVHASALYVMRFVLRRNTQRALKDAHTQFSQQLPGLLAGDRRAAELARVDQGDPAEIAAA